MAHAILQTMKHTIRILVLLLLATVGAVAQAPQTVGPLEEQLVGHWVLQGTLTGKETTHE
jgi:hypothetical protein